MFYFYLFQLNAANKAYYEGSMQSLPRGVGGGYVDRMKGMFSNTK